MKNLLRYIKSYFLWLNKRVFFSTALFIAVAIFCNYHFHLQHSINSLSTWQEYFVWYFIFWAAFSFGYLMSFGFKKLTAFRQKSFVFLWLLAPAIFAWKMVYYPFFSITKNSLENELYNRILYWPFKLLVVASILFIVWKLFDKDKPFYGTGAKKLSLLPYFFLLLFMLPLIAAASTQHDFLHTYPKMQKVQYLFIGNNIFLKKLFYELAYGSDFITIELFFRGFLVLAFAKWAGKDAILPMALFYCTIHFGKPLGECISSFFGGLILGAITYETKSIWGGLMVHLGIAWLMELGGYLGHLYF